MQYKVYSRQNFNLVDTGAVVAYDIDYDYLVMNNSTITIARKTEALIGDIIVLIKNSGAYKIGCITAVDNQALSISFQDCKQLFDDNILNPTRHTEETYRYEGISGVAAFFKEYILTNDAYKRIKLQVEEIGCYGNAVWDYKGNSVNLKQYLIDCFDRYNIILKFRINFSLDGKDNYLVISVIHNINTGLLLKDNIRIQTLSYSEAQDYEYTVANVIDKETKELYQTYYLLTDGGVSEDPAAVNRALPVRTIIVEWDSAGELTAKEIAENALRGKEYNHYVQSTIKRDNLLFNVDDLSVGDRVRVITAPVMEALAKDDPTFSEIETVFTGIKENSSSDLVTLVFGKARKSYVDKIQLLLRKGVNR